MSYVNLKFSYSFFSKYLNLAFTLCLAWCMLHEIDFGLKLEELSVHDEGSSRIWGEIHLERKWVWTLKWKGGKRRTSIGGFCGTEGNHATWRRFQDKWGRSATLNRRFKDKDRWFWGEPQDLRENSLFHKTQIWIQMCLTMAYILWAETPKRPNITKGLVKRKQKHYKNYKSSYSMI